MASASVSVGYGAAGGLRVGDVISRGFGVWKKIAWPCSLLYAVASAPAFVDMVARLQHKLTQQYVLTWRYWTVLLLAAVFGLVARAVTIKASAQVIDDGGMRLAAAIDTGVARSVPLLGAWICAGLALALAALLLLVPALMLWSAWYLISPVCVLEALGPIESIKRSARLTKGSRWRIFGLIIILMVIASIAQAVPLVGTQLAMGATAAAAVQVIVQSLVGTFATAVSVVVYQDLRAAREGVSGTRIAAVFD